jgi:DegV family protein with EDD domain
MGGRVAVVTDSTACLDAGEAARLGISVVPLRVIVGGTAFAETDPDVGHQVAEAMRSGVTVTTSRPSPADFLAAYRTVVESGAKEIVSIHLSGDLSGTKDAARLAGLDAPVPVTVVDSRQVTMGLGFAVLAAATAAADGADAHTVAALARTTAGETTTLFYVDTLEYLRKGGRIGAARAMLGSALAMKPLLQVDDGRIAVLSKVRTASRALSELERLAVAAATALDGNGVRVAVHHLASAVRAEELATRLQGRLPASSPPLISTTPATIGAHVGPGTLAVVIAPR